MEVCNNNAAVYNFDISVIFLSKNVSFTIGYRSAFGSNFFKCHYWLLDSLTLADMTFSAVMPNLNQCRCKSILRTLRYWVIIQKNFVLVNVLITSTEQTCSNVQADTTVKDYKQIVKNTCAVGNSTRWFNFLRYASVRIGLLLRYSCNMCLHEKYQLIIVVFGWKRLVYVIAVIRLMQSSHK